MEEICSLGIFGKREEEGEPLGRIGKSMVHFNRSGRYVRKQAHIIAVPSWILFQTMPRMKATVSRVRYGMLEAGLSDRFYLRYDEGGRSSLFVQLT